MKAAFRSYGYVTVMSARNVRPFCWIVRLRFVSVTGFAK